MLTRSVYDMDKLIVKNLHKIAAIPFDVIVHCPRSGTIPASIISTYLCRPLASVEEVCLGLVSERKSFTSRTGRLLLVDDSIRTGKQIKGFIAKIREAHPDIQIETLCIYSTEVRRDFQPTLILESHNERMYIYSWFMWKTDRVKACAVDMDGVLCRDCTKREDDDGHEYQNFLLNVQPKFIPFHHEIGAIVTGRLEKYRPETEHWLKENGVKYRELHMGPFSNKHDRKAYGAGRWKGEFYAKASNFSLFVESSAKEAQIISDISGKAVWCVDDCRGL